jgi:hypothetical protein
MSLITTPLDLNVDFLDRIDIGDVPDSVRLNLLLVTFATKDGELQGIPYSKGFRIAADAELLGMTATASVRYAFSKRTAIITFSL